ncbi:MAG TPA: glycosyltransferase [Solirubrobacteraceae bacterium]|jgi:cellulose synthase/poly-beta-1,6-N-acetylglucosamine synthase-like glycosyltransferase|nr:glycosyltransferase [Solirubrobacteraceae bacterium]
MRPALEAIFWIAVAPIAWTQVGYALFIGLLARVFGAGDVASASAARGTGKARQDHPPDPSVSLIVAAHEEERVIGGKVANALALHYPRELLQVIVACDGCEDATAARARTAGADLVLELPRGGKIAAQNAAVERARGEIVAFSDANALWAPEALRELVAAFADARVGYACGRVRFVRDAQATDGEDATNQEGVYWSYEMALRARESRLCSITAGNGAIYATRRESYIVVDPVMGHDLSFPFNMVKRGWRAVEAPAARATEKMVPSIEGEWRRKRRMMSHTWPIVVRGGMLSPRGYPPGYALMILSHRVLRYLLPFLHALALACNAAVVVLGAGTVYLVTLALQLALLFAAALARVAPARPLLIARYYVLTAASPAAGLWDWLRHGTEASWQAAEGTR